jgi:hypothetical protein
VNIRAVLLSRFSAAACATVVTALSAWAFVSSTASIERDPFQYASITLADSDVRVAHTVGPQGGHRPKQVRVYGLPDLLVPLPVCLKGCA